MINLMTVVVTTDCWILLTRKKPPTVALQLWHRKCGPKRISGCLGRLFTLLLLQTLRFLLHASAFPMQLL